MKQYGQVFLASDKNFFVSCIHCDPEYNGLIDYNEFRNHVLEVHLEDPLSIGDLCLQEEKYLKQELIEKSVEQPRIDELSHVHDVTIDSEKIFKKEQCSEKDFRLLKNYDNDYSQIKAESNELLNEIKVENVCNDVEMVESDGSLPCDVCNKFFTSERLKKHKARKRCGTCSICNTQFSDLYKHIRNNHKDHYEEKRKIKITLNDINLLNNTSETQKTEEKLTSDDNKNITNILCPYCGETFSAEYFQTHQAQRKCGKCPVCFLIVTDLFRHVPKNHKVYVEEKKRLKEKVVKRLPLSEDELSLKKLKEESTTEEENHITLMQQNATIIELNNIISPHELIELKKDGVKNSLLCKYCEKTFKCKGNYNKHIKQHETKSDTCKFCGKSFKLLSRLKKHLRLHTGERPYKCEICSVSFNESSNLKAHFINRHTEGLNLKCTYENCGKIFKTNARRRYHEFYAHSNKYNNLCKECGLIFRTSGSLNEHTKKKHIKYEDREFSCKFCEKKFAFKFELTPHEMVHLGQKRYQCELCTKGFIARKSFKRHCRTVHGKEIEEITKNE